MLHERGRPEDAARMQADALAPLVAELRDRGEAPAAIDERLAAVFATEQERVANAAALADLLLPLLSEQLRPLAPQPGIVPSASALAPRAPKPPRAAPAGIADFIDEMIEQERDTGPAATDVRRRAS